MNADNSAPVKTNHLRTYGLVILALVCAVASCFFSLIGYEQVARFCVGATVVSTAFCGVAVDRPAKDAAAGR